MGIMDGQLFHLDPQTSIGARPYGVIGTPREVWHYLFEVFTDREAVANNDIFSWGPRQIVMPKTAGPYFAPVPFDNVAYRNFTHSIPFSQ